MFHKSCTNVALLHNKSPANRGLIVPFILVNSLEIRRYEIVEIIFRSDDVLAYTSVTQVHIQIILLQFLSMCILFPLLTLSTYTYSPIFVSEQDVINPMKIINIILFILLTNQYHNNICKVLNSYPQLLLQRYFVLSHSH